MKKTLLICMLLLAITFSPAACGNDATHTHSFGEWEVTIKPTCTENGTKVRYCLCGEKQTEIVISLGHTPADAVIEDKVDATYESDGSYNEVVRCSTCNEKLSETSHTIPMLKHTPAEAVTENIVDATCYREGGYDTVVYCSDCGVELERTKHTIDKVAHTPADAVEENRTNATYENDGSYQMVIYCSVAECRAELERTTHVLDMLVHHPGDVVIENEVMPTCYTEGSYDEVVYCLDADCGHKELSRKTVTTSKTAHTPADAIVENLIQATCTTNGSYDEVVYCSVENCKVQISRNTKIVDALGHTEVIDEAVAPTCTETGLTEGKHCSVCDATLVAQEPVPTEHRYENNHCTLCGNIKYSEGLKYTSKGDGTCYVSGIGTCTDTEIIIPNIYNGDIVTGIGAHAFRNCNTLTQIVIPDSVTIIGAEAFYYCTSLTNVSFGDSVKSIGDYAFVNCGFTEIVIPDSVTDIGVGSFRLCRKLERIVIPMSVISIRNYAFNNCPSLTIYCSAKSKPDGWESDWNFGECPVVWRYTAG